MIRPSFLTRAAPVGIGLVALAAAGAAHARSDVPFSIGVQPSYEYVQPRPVYVQPRPIYLQPQPVYVQPRPIYVQPQPVYVQPRPIYVQPQPVYVQPHPIYVQPQPVYAPRHGYHGGARRGPWGDHDGDGVPNRHDRDHPRNQWRQVEGPHWYRH